MGYYDYDDEGRVLEDIDIFLGDITVLHNSDMFVAGFFDYSDDIFFYDLLDSLSLPDDIKLYDFIGGAIVWTEHLEDFAEADYEHDWYDEDYEHDT